MKRLLFALALTALSACSGAGTDPKATCPDTEDQAQALSRAEWRACFGRQDHDASPGK